MRYYKCEIKLTFWEEIIYELNEYNVSMNTELETALKYYLLKLAERLNQQIETYNILNKVAK